MQIQRSLTSAYGGRVAIINIFTTILVIFCAVTVAFADNPIRIVAIGDSLTAGYGLPQGEDFPTQLQAALKAKGMDVIVENAGVSGDTTTGGVQRIDWALGNGADFVILELGANDALRGIDPATTRKNLDAILGILKDRNVPVLLTGMRAPPNMGQEYIAEFDQIFPDLAQKYQTDFYPFFLEDVASIPALNQGDYIHPNAEGVRIIVNNMLPYVMSFIRN